MTEHGGDLLNSVVKAVVEQCSTNAENVLVLESYKKRTFWHRGSTTVRNARGILFDRDTYLLIDRDTPMIGVAIRRPRQIRGLLRAYSLNDFARYVRFTGDGLNSYWVGQGQLNAVIWKIERLLSDGHPLKRSDPF